jgi:hypothetical protein
LTLEETILTVFIPKISGFIISFFLCLLVSIYLSVSLFIFSLSLSLSSYLFASHSVLFYSFIFLYFPFSVFLLHFLWTELNWTLVCDSLTLNADMQLHSGSIISEVSAFIESIDASFQWLCEVELWVGIENVKQSEPQAT